MKKLFFIIAIFCSIHILAQSKPKVELSYYYLIDTAKTPANDRMWEIYGESQYRYYAIKCPCLKFKGKPTFVHLNDDKGQIISEKKLKSIKLISLSTLINKASQFLSKDVDRDNYLFFLIEHIGSKYVIHQDGLINPLIQIVAAPDVIIIKPDTSAFTAKNLIKVNSKDINKYLNQLVITDGHVVNTHLFEPDYKVLLYIGADQPNQDFTIVIEAVNSNKFDHPEEQFKGRWIKVTGKVITYNVKPAIEISDPDQIQLLH